MPRLEDLIHRCIWEDLLNTLTIRTIEPKHRQYFKNTWKYLKVLNSRKTILRICLYYTEHEDGDYHHVSGKNGEWDVEMAREKRYNISFNEWEEWLGMRIDDETYLNFSEADIVSACLYEMTWSGRSPTLVREKRHELSVRPSIFISHASEDKADFVRPLVEELQELGLTIWYDEFELKVGDSLRERIAQGIAKADYGIIVFSKAFFAKSWTKHELSGFISMELNNRSKILPIWHKLTLSDVLNFDPSLADKVALSSESLSIEQIAVKIDEKIYIDRIQKKKDDLTGIED